MPGQRRQLRRGRAPDDVRCTRSSTSTSCVPGDAIVIETRTTWFTYTVQTTYRGRSSKYQEIVSPTDFEVTYPVPDQPNPNATPTQRVLTFTSCNPRYSASQRIVVHALLTSRQPTSQGLPPALAGSGAS